MPRCCFLQTIGEAGAEDRIGRRADGVGIVAIGRRHIARIGAEAPVWQQAVIDPEIGDPRRCVGRALTGARNADAADILVELVVLRIHQRQVALDAQRI